LPLDANELRLLTESAGAYSALCRVKFGVRIALRDRQRP
jgi:hypothetical protein